MYELRNCESKLQECESNMTRLKAAYVFSKAFEKKRAMFAVFTCNTNLILLLR